MRHTSTIVIRSLLLVGSLAGTLASVQQRPASRGETTRASLAAAYMRIDQAISYNVPSGERLAEINRAFDAASMLFFANRFDEAASRIDDLTRSLLADTPAAESLRRMAGVSSTMTPAILALDTGRDAAITFVRRPEGDRSTDAPVAVRIEVLNVSGVVIGGTTEPGRTFVLQDGATTIPITLNEHAAPGRVSVIAYVAHSQHPPHPLTLHHWSLVASRLDPIREANAKRLSALEGREGLHPQSLATALARNKLLIDSPSSTASAQFLANPATLAESMDREIAALEQGDDPYVHRHGDDWRIISHQGTDLPLRVFVPKDREPQSRRPLIIALHGAGGDENMFPEAYGAGIIKQLAEEHDFILASPLTYPLAGDATLLDALIEEMDRCHRIDRDRIHLVGHSLGAMTALGLSQMRREAIASCCAIAGGSVPRKPEIPPTLVIVAEFDGLAGPGAAERGRAAAERAQASGVPVQYRIMRDWGHTLVVGAALPEAIEWLLSNKRMAKGAENAPLEANSSP